MTNLRNKNQLQLAVVLALLSTSLVEAQSTSPTGSVQINVTNPQGQPLAGAAVRYTRLPNVITEGRASAR